MKNKNKICKTSFVLVIGMISIMLAAASVNAEKTEEDTVPILENIIIERDNSEGEIGEIDIMPGQEEPLIISPNPNILPEETDYRDDFVIAGDTTKQSEIKDISLTGFAIIAAVSGTVAALIIIKGKNK